MAVISVLVGGLFGFASFLISWLAFGSSLLGALGVYLVVGTSVSIVMLAVGLIQVARMSDSDSRRAQEAAIRAWDHDAIADRMASDHIRDQDDDSRVA